MRKTKLYDWESIFDFGQYEGESLKEVFDKNLSYINWCFQKIDWFCITDEIFEKLAVVIAFRKDNKIDNVKEQKDWLKILTDKHSQKKLDLNNVEHSHNRDDYECDFEYNENPWVDVFGEGEEAETAYWNTN